MDKFDIAKSLNVLKSYAGINDVQLSESIGVSRQAIQQMQKINNYKVNTLTLHADALGFDIDIIFTNRETGKQVKAIKID